MTRRSAQYSKKTVVAHRGASAYAPEHTLAAYQLAIEMGADFVEQDLAVTKDGVLICLHDASLERTTNVEELFPDRVSTQTIEGKTRKAWLANDFTLAEIKRLDAGSWFDKKFAGERVPTFDEAIALIRGKAGIFPELKTPEIYAGRDVKFEEMVAAALDKNGLRGAQGRSRRRRSSCRRSVSRAHASWPRSRSACRWCCCSNDDEGFKTAEQLKAWKGIVQGFGPTKSIVLREPGLREVGARRRHVSDAVHVPLIGRRRNPDSRTSTEEMSHYLYKLGVDALFTDNPDKFPQEVATHF